MSEKTTIVLLSADQILGSTDLPDQVVDVPEWGGQVRLITMTGKERDAFEQDVIDEKGKMSRDNIRARLLVRCIVDEAGNRVFNDDQAESLGAKGSRAINRLFSVASRLNGLSKSDVEELAKNS